MSFKSFNVILEKQNTCEINNIIVVQQNNILIFAAVLKNNTYIKII